MLDNKLIENALALTGKTMEDMETIDKQKYLQEEPYFEESLFEFSIEKFYAFLLSPEFIEKYMWRDWDLENRLYFIDSFWTAIYEYQSGNEQPLISLLEKIWAK